MAHKKSINLAAFVQLFPEACRAAVDCGKGRHYCNHSLTINREKSLDVVCPYASSEIIKSPFDDFSGHYTVRMCNKPRNKAEDKDSRHPEKIRITTLKYIYAKNLA